MTTTMFGVEGVRAAYRALRSEAQDEPTAPVDTVPEAETQETAQAIDQRVFVVGVSGGVGTTTVALALAEAIESPQLVELAPPRFSGLSAATTAELGIVDGWNRGKRSEGHQDLIIFRALDDSSGLPPGATELPSVVDLGLWPPNRTLVDETPLVLVAACSVPGARRLDATLQEIQHEFPHLSYRAALVGSTGRTPPKAVVATFGSTLRRLHNDGRVTYFPEHAPFRMQGVTTASLPKPIQHAAGTLARTLEES